MHTREISIGQNTLRFETGKLAKQAHGSVIVRFGDSVVLVTACRAANPREGIDFLPLTVDYREYTYASGRIPGGFFKREGKPAEKEVLTSRMHRPADRGRCSRPAGASRRRSSRSCCPPTRRTTPTCWRSPAPRRRSRSRTSRSRRRSPRVRIGLVDGQYIVNPTFQQRKESKLDLIVAGSKDGLVMVEAGAKEVTEEQVVEALDTAHAAIKQIVAVDRRPREGSRQEEADGRRRRKSATTSTREVEEQGLRAADRGDAHPRQARELRDASTRRSRTWSRRFPKAKSSGRPTPRRSSRS